VVASVTYTMANFTVKEPDLEDGLGKWFNTNDGKRQYLRMKEDQFNDPDFKAKCVDAFNLNFQPGETPEAFKYKDETFSVNVFNGYGQVYRGAAAYPSKEPIKLPAKWGQTNFGGNKGTGGFNKKPYTPPKQVVNFGIKNPKALTLGEAIDDCTKNPDRVFLFNTVLSDEDGYSKYITGEVAVIE
jgi:hypothetical protein